MAELDGKYIERMEDVLALYERPYDAAEPVVCLDEKPVSLHKEVRPPRPAAPGHTAKRDNEYRRCGTANVFAVVEPKTGRHFTYATPNRTAAEFAKTLGSLLDRYPSARTIHLVWDNLHIHCKKSLTDYYGKKQGGEMWSRLTIHRPPIHGSWLNRAEIELSLYSRQCPGSRRIPDLETLQRETRSWKDRVNRDQVKINWKFDRRATRKNFGYKRTPSGGRKSRMERCGTLGAKTINGKPRTGRGSQAARSSPRIALWARMVRFGWRKFGGASSRAGATGQCPMERRRGFSGR